LTDFTESVTPGDLVFLDPPAGGCVQVILFEEQKVVGNAIYVESRKLVYFIDYFLGTRDLCKILLDGKLGWCRTQHVRREDG
jgi:hypothetical protein